MDDAAAVWREETSQVTPSDAKTAQLMERFERLLREAAEVEVELSRASGSIKGVPHYSVIEGRAHELGQRLSREVQQRQMREVVASQPVTGKCPGCGTRCELQPFRRDVNSVDGVLPFQELVGDCPRCRRSFFPATGDVRV